MATKKIQILGSLLEVDDSLTQSGKAADAKVTGELINGVKLYADNAAFNAANQKTQVQIITWEADE